jgi:hypothetical protein
VVNKMIRDFYQQSGVTIQSHVNSVSAEA